MHVKHLIIATKLASAWVNLKQTLASAFVTPQFAMQTA